MFTWIILTLPKWERNRTGNCSFGLRLENGRRNPDQFVAREVFVGTMSTLYSLEDDAPEVKVIDKMRRDVKPNGKSIQLCNRDFRTSFLCICNAVCFYTCSSLQRNQKLEMDWLTGGYDDRFGIFCVDDSISNFKVMDSSLIFQYVLVALIVAFACYSLFKVLKKNFAPKNSVPKELLR
jgi:Fe2+ transport system protein B